MATDSGDRPVSKRETMPYEQGIENETPPPMAELTKAELLAGEVRYAMKSQTHLWVVSATFTVDKEMLRAGGGETELLNPERVRQLGAGCLVCSEAYDPRLLDRKCKGDPGGVKIR